MTTVNVTELRQHLPAYLKRAAAGEEILIASHGKIIARLLPEEDPSPRSSPESVPLLPGQPPFLPLVPRLFEAHLPNLLQHGRSVHQEFSFAPS
jgi:prevent-host-death family protein